MERSTLALANQEFDLVVVGGGIFGVCAVWDAIGRGLRVALIERADFAGQTSANSYRMVHGGIRYLQHADLVRLRRSCAQRSLLLRLAPHLVQPLPIAVPTYGHGRRGKALLGAGMLLYDLLTADRNRRIPDPARRIPWTQFLSASEVRGLFPGLPAPGLTGAAVFHDAQMYNPPRLALAFLRAAVDAGAVAANYVAATGFVCANGRVVGVEAEDRSSGARFVVRAKVVLNAAGPWAEGLLGRSLGLRLRRSGRYLRDVCLVLGRPASDRYGLAVPAGGPPDGDAWVSRAARHLFLVPWRGQALVGVWHAADAPDPDRTVVTAAELAGFIDGFNAAYPGLDLAPDDVTLCCAGLVPQGETVAGEADLRFGKRSIVVDHARDHGVEGLVTLIGIRYTMAVGDAAQAIDLVARKLGRGGPRPAAARPLFGGQIEDFEALVRTAGRRVGEALPPPSVRALIHNYGSEYGRILDYAIRDPALLRTIGTTTVVAAEVAHAVREEMAIALGDVVFRRTDFATARPPREADLATCARLMAAELGWSGARMATEIAAVRRTLAAMRPHVVERPATTLPLAPGSDHRRRRAAGAAPG